ncbi:MAG: MBL fold metallo-hydrolase [Eubacteriaceae bacterium]|uniref:MBL fold metallo-hydrolase n=1 Tax=Candidatus Pseudoramibacter fermentans TaxID=2594427 RepID=A0A6L5GRY4_9FIRM|nr:MBL fold metallo-hydrolase [Candidatus Pseudoramibacter fermentans]RRF93641.1 MAG: MBL fold metallo-hydrolase [Eubacteriaceae bacterium]
MRKQVKNNVSWIGYMDWDLQKFHGDDFTIHSGSSQNAYLIEEEKTVLMDTVWAPHQDDFLKNLESEIDLKKIDYIVVNHGENDHSGSLPALLEKIPGTPIYCTANAVKSLEGQYGKRGWDFHVVHTGDTLDIGNGKQLIFVEMRFLHWPDSMATYLTGDNILFSMDAFGQHYAVEEMFADKADQETLWNEAQRYFANIVAPFSPLVTKKVKEIAALNLPIEMIAPSHGAIWRKDPMKIVEAYAKWADAYQEDQITVVYATEWHGTEKIAHAIADEIHKQAPDTVVKVFNVDHTEKDDIIGEVFKSKAIAVGSPTILNGILASVEGFLYYLKSLKYKGKKAAVFGCYGWSGEGNKILREKLTDAGFEVVQPEVRSSWNPDADDFANIPALVQELIGADGAASKEAAEEETPSLPKWQCPCGYIYDPAKGDPEHGVKPGTAWEDVPADWTCPVCGLPKEAFEKID